MSPALVALVARLHKIYTHVDDAPSLESGVRTRRLLQVGFTRCSEPHATDAVTDMSPLSQLRRTVDNDLCTSF